MSDAVKFDRKPYTISWRDAEGEIQKTRRVPPPKLHEALASDKVELTKSRSDDFMKGEVTVVKHINPRHPNVLKVMNDDGQTTFVGYNEIELKEKIAPHDGISPIDTPARNKYLRWP
jgi:hypothetical protein